MKTQFDRVRDQEQVAQLLHAGCTHMRKAFDIEDINLEDLIATALDDPQAVGENKAFHGINFADCLVTATLGSAATMGLVARRSARVATELVEGKAMAHDHRTISARQFRADQKTIGAIA
jgi:hypothetical protein